MNDREKTRTDLLEELRELRHKVAELQTECTTLRDQTPRGELDAVLLQTSDAVVVYDPELRYTYINQTGASFLGLAANDVVGKTNRDIMGSGADSIEPFVRKAFAEKDRVFVLHDIPVADGIGLFDTVYTPVVDESGAVRRVIGICRDVTADKLRTKEFEGLVDRRTAELAQGNDRLRSEIADRVEQPSTLELILAKAADGICVCHNIPEEPYVRFTHWNPRMQEITGFTIDEINRLGWYQTMYPDLEIQQKAVERMAAMREGDDIKTEEWAVTTKDGSQKSLSISTSVMKKENDQTYVLAVMQDISERKNAEEERERSLSHRR